MIWGTLYKKEIPPPDIGLLFKAQKIFKEVREYVELWSKKFENFMHTTAKMLIAFAVLGYHNITQEMKTLKMLQWR